jgi:hypothetical protein
MRHLRLQQAQPIWQYNMVDFKEEHSMLLGVIGFFMQAQAYLPPLQVA